MTENVEKRIFLYTIKSQYIFLILEKLFYKIKTTHFQENNFFLKFFEPYFDIQTVPQTPN